MRSLIVIILSLSLLMSCKKSNERRCVKSSGNISAIVLEDISATQINMNDNISLTLVNDSLNQIEIKGGENLLSFITHEILGSQIIFNNTNKCNFLRNEDKIAIIYHYTHLDSIFLNGFGNLNNLDTIKHDIYIYTEESFSDIALAFNNNNTTLIAQVGSVETLLSGKCDNLYLYSNGAGKMDARDLECKYAHGHSQGLGDFFINAKDYLNIELRSAGNFYVYNAENAIQNIVQEGSGQIIFQ